MIWHQSSTDSGRTAMSLEGPSEKDKCGDHRALQQLEPVECNQSADTKSVPILYVKIKSSNGIVSSSAVSADGAFSRFLQLLIQNDPTNFSQGLCIGLMFQIQAKCVRTQVAIL